MYVAVVVFTLRNVDFGHSVPHYHVVSHKAHEGVVSAVGAFIRKWLLEDVYRRIGAFAHFIGYFCGSFTLKATMFPETANWLTPADE
jgi:KUP system potassium uptake protein